MAHYWWCDRCDRNTKEEENLEILSIEVKGLIQTSMNNREFELCVKCFNDLLRSPGGLAGWGEEFLIRAEDPSFQI
jgi:hypothetical protein